MVALSALSKAATGILAAVNTTTTVTVQPSYTSTNTTTITVTPGVQSVNLASTPATTTTNSSSTMLTKTNTFTTTVTAGAQSVELGSTPATTKTNSSSAIVTSMTPHYTSTNTTTITVTLGVQSMNLASTPATTTTKSSFLDDFVYPTFLGLPRTHTCTRLVTDAAQITQTATAPGKVTISALSVITETVMENGCPVSEFMGTKSAFDPYGVKLCTIFKTMDKYGHIKSGPTTAMPLPTEGLPSPVFVVSTSFVEPDSKRCPKN